MVRNCIEAQSADCPDRLKVLLKRFIGEYDKNVFEDSCSILPQSISDVNDDSYFDCQQNVTQGEYGKYTTSNSPKNLHDP